MTILSDLRERHAREMYEPVQACRGNVTTFEENVFAGVTLRPNVKKRLLSEVLFALGHNPELRIAVVAATRMEAKDTMMDLVMAIRNNTVLRCIFPTLVPSNEEGARWNTTELTVQRPTRMTDASVQTVYPYTNAAGSRFDLVVVSGPTPTSEWYQNEILSRLTENGREIPILG